MRPRAAVVILSILVSGAATAQAPVPVSPGGLQGVAIVAGCPTFHWTAVEADSLELVLYRVPPEGAEGPPARVLSVVLPGAASGWTPSLDRCPEPGQRYAWSVRAARERTLSEWSSPRLFDVASPSTETELAEAIAIVRRYLVEENAASNQSRRLPAVIAEMSVDRGEAVAHGVSAPVSDSAVLPVGELDCRAGRYEDNGDGTVTDCRTGLVWLQDGECEDLGQNGTGLATWQEALDAAAALASGSCGLTDGSTAGDWRLATKTEWLAMVASSIRQGITNPTMTDARGTSQWTTDGDAFTDVTPGTYWTATEWTGPSDAWQVWLLDGSTLHSNKFGDSRVWPVRAG